MKSSSIALALVVRALAFGGERPLERYESVEPAMGTLVRITLYAKDSDTARGAFGAAFARVHELDGILSDYKPDSELMRLCRAETGQPVHLSADLFAVLEQSQELARATNGAFDVTLGPLIRLWRAARKQGALPAEADIEAARARSGYRHLTLDSSGRTATLSIPKMQLDLGAIAKGYAAGEALRVLMARGVASALVAISGDLAIGDPPPGKAGWRVGIGSAERVRTLSNTCVSTSGDAEQFAEIGGVRYSHIVDPRTGVGLKGRRAASVVAVDCALADGLATAFSIAGDPEAEALQRLYPGARRY